MRTFREDEWAGLVGLLHKLDMMCDIQEKVATACNCSFFYWHRVILPTYFANLYESKMDLHRLMVRKTFLITFLNVCNRASTSCAHSPNINPMLKKYELHV
jgi:WASH complex subunit 7